MKRPLGVTIIAIVLTISGILNILVGLIGLDILKIDLGTLATGAQANAGALVISGILTLIVAAGMFATSTWAWWLTVAVMIFRIVVDGWAVIAYGWSSTIGYSALVNVVISLIILWYFNRANVRAAFGR
jgi:hypothetical protein